MGLLFSCVVLRLVFLASFILVVLACSCLVGLFPLCVYCFLLGLLVSLWVFLSSCGFSSLLTPLFSLSSCVLLFLFLFVWLFVGYVFGTFGVVFWWKA